MVRRTLETSTELEQFVLVDAQDGSQALDLASGMLPDLILLDINLPDVSGWEILEKLKADNATATIPVILLTATPDDVRAAQNGAMLCLSKPIEPKRLLEKVKMALSAQYADKTQPVGA